MINSINFKVDANPQKFINISIEQNMVRFSCCISLVNNNLFRIKFHFTSKFRYIIWKNTFFLNVFCIFCSLIIIDAVNTWIQINWLNWYQVIHKYKICTWHGLRFEFISEKHEVKKYIPIIRWKNSICVLFDVATKNIYFWNCWYKHHWFDFVLSLMMPSFVFS